MFGLFKKRPAPAPGGEPHPQHRNFARLFLPDALARHRGDFLAAMTHPSANQALQESWQKFGAGVLAPEQLLPPTGLAVSGFHHERHLCLVIFFPAPQAAGESHYGFIVAGPSDDWSPAARARVPVRYFLLEKSAGPTPVMFEWKPSSTQEEEVFENLGPGPSPQHPPAFVDAIFTRFYGFKPPG